MTDVVYVVMGWTGEYSDRGEWPVMAYPNEADARAHVEAAQHKADEIEATRKSRFDCPEGANPYDPKMGMDYTGTGYFVLTVPFARLFAQAGVTRMGGDAEGGSVAEGHSTRSRSDAPSPSSSSTVIEGNNDR